MIDPKVSIIHRFHCTQEKSNLQKMKERLQKQERFMRTKINFILGKNGGHTLSSIGGWSHVVVKEADKIFAVYNF